MSMYLNFEPHSWYMGFAIKKDSHKGATVWLAYTDNGNTYRIDEVGALKLADLEQRIRDYHLQQHNRYGKLIARRRLEYLRGAIQGEHISTSEIAELQSLTPYIELGDIELLEWAGVPEASA